jgi:hypothetical protein
MSTTGNLRTNVIESQSTTNRALLRELKVNLNKLQSNESSVVYDYVRNKFRKLKGIFTTRAARKTKCIDYWIASENSEYGQTTIERVYQEVFGELFPVDEAKAIQTKREKATSGKAMIAVDDWADETRKRVAELDFLLLQLKQWEDEQEFQTGEKFLIKLKAAVSTLSQNVCDPTTMKREFNHYTGVKSKAATVMEDGEASIEVEALCGLKQSASLHFEARSQDWGTINAKLEESFKAGAWGNGSAKAQLEKLGFSTEVQAAIAIGAQLNVEGSLEWSGGKTAIQLGGKAEVFVGGRANLEAKLSASAIKGIQAAISAGAFIGFSATLQGSAKFSYDGQELGKVTAEAGITFGAGAKFEASIKAPIFGPTAISVSSELSLGLGVSAAASVEINFNKIALAGNQAFVKLVYRRTLSKGYEASLINSDATNRYYLKKSINAVKAAIAELNESLDSYERTPEIKRGLLRSRSV